MKNKIFLKLTLYFSVALLVFSLIISAVFMVLFRNYTINLHKADIEKRATTIAKTLSSFTSNNNKGHGEMSGMGGYGAYLRFLKDIAMTDAWVVDNNLELITPGHGYSTYTYSDLPENAEEIVAQVFTGKVMFSENFSSLLQIPTLTVGAPIINEDGNTTGVVLLHSSVEGINLAVSKGFSTLGISLCIALIISFLLSIALSLSFTKPLKEIKNTILRLASGDYLVKTNILQQDEIGEVATAIDLLACQLHTVEKQKEGLDQMRTDFIANISHELKTPVTVIRGSLEALCDGVITDPTQVDIYHSQMLTESKFLQRLIADLLDLSKLQNIDFLIEMEPLNICDVLDDVIRSGKRLASDKNLNINIENSSQPHTVVGDYGRLRQMFMIILDNAIKFSPQNGSIYIILNLKDRLYISIKDNGIGIPEKDIPYIFDRFYKTKSKDNKNGTGLGLAIAKQIATRHGVSIQVRSSEDTGCEFIFTFPQLG